MTDVVSKHNSRMGIWRMFWESLQWYCEQKSLETLSTWKLYVFLLIIWKIVAWKCEISIQTTLSVKKNTVPKTINVDIYLRSRSRVNNDCCLRGRQQEPCTSDLLLIRGNRVNPTFSCPHSLIPFSFKTETCCLKMPQRKHKYLTCSESWFSVRFL